MTTTANYANVETALDAERDAIIACMNAEYAVPEVKAAREAHLADVRAELAAFGLTR